MRPVNDTEASVVRWFAAQVDNPLRQSLLADLNQATAEVTDFEQLTIRFEISGYNRPPYRGERPVPVDAAVQDTDGATLAVVLATDENRRLFELQVIRFEKGPVLGPDWSTLRRLMPGEIIRLNALE
jgi:hypothetical protein